MASYVSEKYILNEMASPVFLKMAKNAISKLTLKIKACGNDQLCKTPLETDILKIKARTPNLG